MTLLEVLLGVVLLTLVGALAFSLVLGARRSMERQADWEESEQPALACLDVMIQDLACCLVPAEGEAPVFRLTRGSAGSTVTCVTAAPPEEQLSPLPLSRHRVLRVVWKMEPAPGPGGAVLVRTARPERASGEAGETRFRLAGVTDFEVRVYDPATRDWVELWDAGQGGALPPAARVTMTVRTSRGDRTLTTDTVIPAGLRIGPASR